MEKGNRKPGYEGLKKPEANLRNYYTILWETGMILALLIAILAVRIEFIPSEEAEYVAVETQEEVIMEEIVQTRQQPEIPPPPRPPVPVEVPNDVIIEDIDIAIDAELDLFAETRLPPPPPPSAEAEEEDDEEEFFVFVEEMPQLKGGLVALQQIIQYPELARRAGIEGRVHVQFIVNELGNVEDPVVIRGIGGGCDEEAVRVVKQAQFSPGLQRGKPVRVQFSLPIYFKIRE
jgi:periplasmic protein TonB